MRRPRWGSPSNYSQTQVLDRAIACLFLTLLAPNPLTSTFILPSLSSWVLCTFSMLKRRFWWPTIELVVRQFVAACSTYAGHNTNLLLGFSVLQLYQVVFGHTLPLTLWPVSHCCWWFFWGCAHRGSYETSSSFCQAIHWTPNHHVLCLNALTWYCTVQSSSVELSCLKSLLPPSEAL